jgi:putative ABC transport system permease protein
MAARFLSDLRYAARIMRKSPVFAVASICVLSVGIAVNTAAFSVMRTLISKPLPFKDSERLVLIRERNPEKGLTAGASYPAFEDWKRQSSVFEELGAVEAVTFNLSGSVEPLNVAGGRVSGGLFRTLGLAPLKGRAFAPEEERAGGNRVVMIGQRFWERRFGSDPGIVGRTLTVDGEEAVIVGVVPRITRGYFTGYDVWAPLAPGGTRDERPLQVAARMKPGVAIERVRAGMDTIAVRLAQQYPESNRGWGVAVFPMNGMMAHVVPAYTILLVVLFLLLLIVCTNIANLQLARAAARHREIAVRLALGATRMRVVWQMLSEGLVLAAASGAAGLLLVVWVRSVLAASVPELTEISIGGEAALFTAFVRSLRASCLGSRRRSAFPGPI